MKHLILVLFLSLGYSQFVPSHKGMLDKIAFLESQLGIETVEPKPEPVDSSKIRIKELVFNAVDYFWKTPRTDSINKLKLAFDKDFSGVNYLITNYRTRIYKDQHEYVLQQLNKIKVIL